MNAISVVMIITPYPGFKSSIFHNLTVRFICRKDKAQQTPGYKITNKYAASESELFSIWIRMQRFTSIRLWIQIQDAQINAEPGM
jgi:hypothetical protein